MEADDIIAWLCHTINDNIMIVSTDQDLYQLINSKVSYYHAFKKKIITIDSFEQDVGIPYNWFLYYKAILGDASDNIVGLDGYGKVKSKKLAQQLVEGGSVSAEQKSIIDRNLLLIDLKIGYVKAGPEEVESYKTQLNELENLEPDWSLFEQYCNEFRFNNFKNNMSEWKRLCSKKNNLVDIINSLGYNK
jgi:5'-3' exonuclease